MGENSRQCPACGCDAYVENVCDECGFHIVALPSLSGDERVAAIKDMYDLDLKMRNHTVALASDSLVAGRVAFAALDILGMKALMNRMPLADVGVRVLSNFLESSVHPDGNFESEGVIQEFLQNGNYILEGDSTKAIFVADTIFLVTLVDTVDDPSDMASVRVIDRLADLVGSIIYANCLQGIFLRGAISFGEMIVSMGSTNFLLGYPMLEAMEWERHQEWFGAMATPSAINELIRPRSVEAQRNLRNLVQYNVPVKDGIVVPSPCLAVDWPQNIDPTFSLHVRAWDVPDQDSPEFRKIDNAIRFAKAGAAYSKRERDASTGKAPDAAT